MLMFPKSFMAILLMGLALAPRDAPKPKPASGIVFVKIPAGEFVMGDADGGDNEKPAHRVVISRGFEMGKYEVTQAQWEAVMGSDPSKFKGADLPVEQVSWEDAQAFLKAMNAKNDGYVYRLPTDAEWEYAARAGATGDYGGTGNLDEMGWYEANAAGCPADRAKSSSRAHPTPDARYDIIGFRPVRTPK